MSYQEISWPPQAQCFVHQMRDLVPEAGEDNNYTRLLTVGCNDLSLFEIHVPAPGAKALK